MVRDERCRQYGKLDFQRLAGPDTEVDTDSLGV